MGSTKKGRPKKRVTFERGIVPIVRAACHHSARKGYLLVWFACVAVHCVLILIIESALLVYEKVTFRRRGAKAPDRDRTRGRAY